MKQWKQKGYKEVADYYAGKPLQESENTSEDAKGPQSSKKDLELLKNVKSSSDDEKGKHGTNQLTLDELD